MDTLDIMADAKCSRLKMPADASGWGRWGRRDARCEMKMGR